MADSERTYRIRADRVRELRKAKGFSWTRLAGLAGINPKTLMRWIKGKPAFPSNIKPVADVLGTTVDDLIDTQDEVIVSSASTAVAALVQTGYIDYELDIDEEKTGPWTRAREAKFLKAVGLLFESGATIKIVRRRREK